MRSKVVVLDRFSIGFLQENQRSPLQRKRRIAAPAKTARKKA
jgi:hypothetical protein